MNATLVECALAWLSQNDPCHPNTPEKLSTWGAHLVWRPSRAFGEGNEMVYNPSLLRQEGRPNAGLAASRSLVCGFQDHDGGERCNPELCVGDHVPSVVRNGKNSMILSQEELVHMDIVGNTY